MSLGGLGLICIICTIAVILKPRKEFLLIAFFASFCASSVIDFGTFNLQPGHYFLILYLITAPVLSRRKLGKLKKPDSWLLAFVVIAFLSIIVAAVFGINTDVIGIGNGNQIKSSRVSFQNYTQYLYLLLGFITYWLMYNYCIEDKKNFEKYVRVLEWSGIAVLAIGVYQLIANTFNLPFDTIFRNELGNIWQTKLRVQSTMNEASFFGQYCVYILFLYLHFPMFKRKMFNYLLIGATIVLGIMSTSSTFMFGGVAVLVLTVALKRQDVKGFVRTFVIFTALAIVAIYAYYSNDYMQNMVLRAVNKLSLDDVSGIQRNYIFSFMINVWKQYPILGVGFGGGRSTDLYANLLAGVGLVGFSAFFGYLIKKMVIAARKMRNGQANINIVFIVSFLLTSVAIPDLTFLPVWCMFALLDAHDYLITHNKLVSIGMKNVRNNKQIVYGGR